MIYLENLELLYKNLLSEKDILIAATKDLYNINDDIFDLVFEAGKELGTLKLSIDLIKKQKYFAEHPEEFANLSGDEIVEKLIKVSV